GAEASAGGEISSRRDPAPPDRTRRVRRVDRWSRGPASRLRLNPRSSGPATRPATGHAAEVEGELPRRQDGRTKERAEDARRRSDKKQAAEDEQALARQVEGREPLDRPKRERAP